MTPTVSGALLGTGLAALIAAAAWRAGSLSRSGAVAALLTGATCMTAGRSWGVFLVVWFITASLASKIGRRAKEAATGDVVAKGGARDAAQVIANGGVFALCALLSMLGSTRGSTLGSALGDSPINMAPIGFDIAVAIMGAAALVAAGADTLATETGTLWRGRPWSLRTLGPVPTGTSGAVSVPGTLGMILGAFALAGLAVVAGLVPGEHLNTVALAGIGGAVADTVIGAFWQARRWCPACAKETEQDVHLCGIPTQPWRGMPWLTNDVVNLLCTVVGAATAWLIVAARTPR